jgi:uncharacterized protein with von Willebrand factor type A (vWA) domain
MSIPPLPTDRALSRFSRYSRWDGTQQIGGLDADEIMRALSDDLMQNGDLQRALQRLFRWGFERPDGQQVPGLQDLLNRLRQRRQEQLQRYDLGSVLEDIQEKLREIVETERAGIDRRLQEADDRVGESGSRGVGEEDAAPGAESSAERQAAEDGQASSPGPSGQPQRGRDGRQAGQRSQDQAGAQADSLGEAGERGDGGEAGQAARPDDDQLAAMRQMLEQLAQKKLDQLDQLPADPGDQIRALHDYEFMDPEARRMFQELLAMLQQQVLQSTFQGMQQALSQMTPEGVAEMRQMLQELNEMLEARQRGEDPNFEQFMHRWGHYFGPDIKNLDDLLAHMQRQMTAMQQLMESMTPEQRGQLEGMMQAIMQDEGLQSEMGRLSQNLGQMMPSENWRQRYRFSGDEGMTLAEALRMMDRLQDYDQLEDELKGVNDWRDLAALDDDKLRDLLGEEDREHVRLLEQLTKILEDAGYVKKTRRGYELTPSGVRKIGEKALQDIFLNLNRDRIGQHDLRRQGGAGERTDTSKPYEFGDPFLLDLPKTVMNAVQRGGSEVREHHSSTPRLLDSSTHSVRLDPSDFEVYRTEYLTRSATVLMVDMSRSMLYNGCFNAAKKVALALDSLIRSKFPRDHLSIVGFSYLAQELKPSELPTLDWNEYNYGTNMQHGFQLARQILGRQKGSNRQVIVITDGEPTAHFEDGNVRFNYPPMPRTFQETLKEVVRCTRDKITINTFMLERSPYMVGFVNDLMRINGGRVFVATPDRLGEYILVDYVANKRKWIG